VRLRATPSSSQAQAANESLFSLCPNEELHERHEWIDGVMRRDCPGIHFCGAPDHVFEDGRCVACGEREDGLRTTLPAPLVTGLCDRGHHDECSGKVYDGHNVRRHGRKVAGYVKCGCDCGHGEEKTA